MEYYQFFVTTLNQYQQKVVAEAFINGDIIDFQTLYYVMVMFDRFISTVNGKPFNHFSQIVLSRNSRLERMLKS
jgi:hypothetical protein